MNFTRNSSNTYINGSESAVSSVALNSDDATWILTSAFIIFTMQSGFGLVESGLVSQKNEVNIMVKNAVDVIYGGLSYWLYGFAFSFGIAEGTNAFCGIGYFAMDVEAEQGDVFALYFFQMSFATTATTIVSGAMAERTHLNAYTIYSFTNTISYVFPAHWLWGEKGFLKELGAIDVAGCSGVHLVGGVAGLVASIMLGPRLGRYDSSVRQGKPGSLTNVLLGTFMLWWGWLGFNCGSTFGMSGGKWLLASRSAVVTLNGSIGGGILGIAYSYYFRKGKLDVAVFITGILGGLVGITAICAVCRPWEAFLIGFIGGVVACGSCDIIDRLKVDDPVGCIGTHAVAGIWGMIAVALFVEEDELEGFSDVRGLLKGGSAKLLGVQILACVVIGAWSALTTWLQLFLINKILPIRLTREQEIIGTDKLEHGIDCNDSEDDINELEHDTLEGEEDGVDSFGEYIKNEAPALNHGAKMDQILSIHNLP
ncbi:putative ammonium transporter 3 [Stylophora pistillata]|uniref:Ammonium transporter n=1 Tax=Stylophora pistillata TaxID=50429 RepID=A0A2B4RSI3_STYPI|nr:putative ammonium transporter 3 [Stylophora pistillata]PFX19288.1 putative ammonium transporter 3 [Stylophora pistillata]